MKIYISTSDKYVHLIEPFAFLFNKFWSSEQQVVVLGYNKPDFKLPKNFEFISMGISNQLMMSGLYMELKICFYYPQ